MFKTLYNRIKKNKNIIKAGKASAPKEQVVKDKDGSEIHARRKKTGIGMTYVRMKDGKEVGYATKDEFRKAKGANESYVGLSDYINESIIGRRGIEYPECPKIGDIYIDKTRSRWKIEKARQYRNYTPKFEAELAEYDVYGQLDPTLSLAGPNDWIVGARSADPKNQDEVDIFLYNSKNGLIQKE